MKKMKKASLLLLALLVIFSPTRSEDLPWPLGAVILGTAAVVVGGLYYLINLPDTCPACDCSIPDGSAKIRRFCGHDFHSDCYNPRAVCRYCEKQQQRAEAFAKTLDAVRDAQEKQQLKEEYERKVLAQEAKDAQQKEMQRLQRERQIAQDRHLAERLAAKEQRNAIAYQATRAQQEELDRIVKKNQEEADRLYAEQLARDEQREAQAAESQRQELARRAAENKRREDERKKQEQIAADKKVAEKLAAEERAREQAAETKKKNEEAAELQRQELARRNAENAKREQELKRQKLAEAAEKRQKDAENKRREAAQVLQDQEIKNAEQARIKSTGWMMEPCVICQEPRAWDEQKNCLIDLKKSENKLHTTVLPCGHLYHTKCIKDWAKTGNHTCPECRTFFKATDL
mgnify:CR=1 FL=1